MTEAKKRRPTEETKFYIQIRRPADVRLQLSPSGARRARVAHADHSAAQLRLHRDVDAIYLHLNRAQAKELAARLAVLDLGALEAP